MLIIICVLSLILLVYIPKLYPLERTLLGISFSEKSWTYLIAFQLLLCEGFSSFASGISGYIGGYLYCIDGFGLQDFRTPEYIQVSKYTGNLRY